MCSWEEREVCAGAEAGESERERPAALRADMAVEVY